MRPQFFKIIALVSALLVASGCKFGKPPVNSPETLAPLGTRSVVSSTLSLVEIWRFRTGIPNTLVSNIQTPPFLFVTSDKVVVASYGDLTKSTDAYLTALSLNSGEIIWQTAYGDPDYGVHIDSAYHDTETNRLFLIYSFRVAGFDLDTGKQLCISPDLGGHTGYIFSYDQGEKLFIDSSKPERITIEPSNCMMLSREPITDQRLTIFRNNIKLYNGNNGFQGTDQVSQLSWVWEGRIGAEFWPTFINDENLVAEFGGPVYYLARINYHTGQKIWNSSLYVMSNYAVYEDRVFALIEDGSLIALDLENGKVVGRMQFDKKIRDGNVASHPFFVVVNFPYLYTYFGDTQELVAFKFETK